VHAVTADGERLGELGRHDAAAADRRVAQNRDVQLVRSRQEGPGGRT